MVRGGRSSPPEAILPRSGGSAIVFAKEVLACLKGVIATALRRLEQVVVLSTSRRLRAFALLWRRGRPISRTYLGETSYLHRETEDSLWEESLVPKAVLRKVLGSFR